MTDAEQTEPDEERETRPAPRKPGSRDSEKALGLEVARLFGLNPRLLVNRPSPPAAPSPKDDKDEADESA
ncbi:MAG TPA: hypothetical protein VG795_00245 [Acidimicrobiia bacterium]|nr:hypothetical protein [Acidimicrobiia bacterium]